MDTQIFEKVKKINEYGQEYRSARDLWKVLEYSEYRFFIPVIEKAKIACKNSLQKVSDHFEDVLEMIEIWKWWKRKIENIKLSRYACYLIIQNADPSKEIVALWQSYFAIQTRKQEIYQQHIEDQKRIQFRDEVSQHNKKLFETAKEAGVYDYANFYDYGYLGLYGMRKKQIIEKKWLQTKDNIFDYMDSEELAANLFRATQAEAKIKRENIKWQKKSSKAHYDVGTKIRQTIKELGWTMPEDIPAVEHIKFAKKRLKDLSYHLEWNISNAMIKKYILPDNIPKLIELATIIKAHTGDIVIQIWTYFFKISSKWKQLIENLLNE